MAANLTLFAQMITGQGSWECQLAEEAAKAPDPAGRDIFLALFGELEGHFPPDRIRAYAEEAIKVDPDLPSANFLLANLLADTDPARAKVLAARALEKAPAGSVLSKIPRYLLDKLEGKPAAGG
jgi:hypothetical protein